MLANGMLVGVFLCSRPMCLHTCGVVVSGWMGHLHFSSLRVFKILCDACEASCMAIKWQRLHSLGLDAEVVDTLPRRPTPLGCNTVSSGQCLTTRVVLGGKIPLLASFP